MDEGGLQNKVVLPYLRKRGGWWYKTPTSIYVDEGTPDILGCYRGLFLAPELKNPRFKQERLWNECDPNQISTINDIIAAGGKSGVFNSLDRIKAWLDEIDRELDGRTFRTR